MTPKLTQHFHFSFQVRSGSQIRTRRVRSCHTWCHHDSHTAGAGLSHFRNLKWRYLPKIRPIFQAYVREYPQKIWPYMVQYLQFRFLKWPLTLCVQSYDGYEYNWLVVDLPLWKILVISQLGWLFPIYGNKTCSNPPTRQCGAPKRDVNVGS